MAKIRERLFTLVDKIERITIVRAIKGGLVMIIPLLIIGAFSLIAMTLPITPYIAFIRDFGGGFIYNFFNVAYTATFGVLSLYMVITISLCYTREKAKNKIVNFGAILTAVICFFIVSGVFSSEFSIDSIGPKGMFGALLTSLIASNLYMFICSKRKHRTAVYSSGADQAFNNALSSLLPMAIVTIFFVAVNVLLTSLFNVETMHSLLINAINALFWGDTVNFGTGLLYIFLSSFLWFFGIHGSDCLEGVAEKIFIPAIDINIADIAAGNPPTQILTKEFFDVFVLMGGCGTAICLLLAVLIFSKQKSNKKLSLISAFPMTFNVNEMMIFGLPVIFNPIMLVPFILTPIVCYSTTYAAMALGWVPLVSASVEWTTPIFFGGYIATNSIAGSAIQLVNLIVGVLIYWPFIVMLDKNRIAKAQSNYNDFVKYYKSIEETDNNIVLTHLDNVYGDIAKVLAEDMRFALANKSFCIYYQPQFSAKNKCVGVEALLRWKHKDYGMIYPPLAIKLAEESDMLYELETFIFSSVISSRQKIFDKFGKGIKISINVSGGTICKRKYLDYVVEYGKVVDYKSIDICLEVTEQTALTFTDDVKEIFRNLKAVGIAFAIDDFSMGQTSIDYIKDNIFSIIKLDGSLVGGIIDNPRCREIIASIVRLADSLDITVLAEFVENEEQRAMLESIGCIYYQGYLYSPAVSLE